VHPIARAAPAPAHTLVPRAASAAPQPTAAARVDSENTLPSPSVGPLAAPGNKSTLPTLGGSPTMNATNAAAAAAAAKPIAPMQLDLSSAMAGHAAASPLAGHGHGHGHGLKSARLAMPVPLPMTDAHVHDALVDGNGGDRSSASHWLPPAAHRERTLWELLAYTPAEQFRKVTLVVRLNAPHVMAIEVRSATRCLRVFLHHSCVWRLNFATGG
jgi:hypothetical protein